MKKIVAVCACPAGIAHTYLAAESLEQAAKAAGYECKVETDGAGGVENELTEDDIREADAVILAVDSFVETDRFYGKPVLEVGITDAVRHGEDVIARITAGDVEIFE